MTLTSARETSVRSTLTGGSVAGTSMSNRMRSSRAGRYGSRISRSRAAMSTSEGFAVGDEAKLENSEAIWRSSVT